MDGKFSNLQLNKLRSRIKSDTQADLNLSSSAIPINRLMFHINYNYDTTNIHVSRICNAFANGSSMNTKFSNNSSVQDGTIRRIAS